MPESDMYKEQILDLFKHPIHFGPLIGATHTAHKLNPSCGDEFTIQLLVRDGKVVNAMFTGSGCAISTASICLLTDALVGKMVDDAKAFTSDDLRKLLGVPVSAARVSCMTLGLDCLRVALEVQRPKSE